MFCFAKKGLEREAVAFINKLYDRWLKAKGENRTTETKGRRKEFANLIGIGEHYCYDLLALGDGRVRVGKENTLEGTFSPTPVAVAVSKGKLGISAATKIAYKPVEIQKEIVERAEEIAKNIEIPSKRTSFVRTFSSHNLFFNLAR